MVHGLVLPAGVVDCGSAPEPTHDTRPEVDYRVKCEAIKASTAPMVDTAAARLKAGDFDPLLARLVAAPKILVPPVDYEDWLARKKVGDIVSPAFFVGRAAAAGAGPPGYRRFDLGHGRRSAACCGEGGREVRAFAQAALRCSEQLAFGQRGRPRVRQVRPGANGRGCRAAGL